MDTSLLYLSFVLGFSGQDYADCSPFITKIIHVILKTVKYFLELLYLLRLITLVNF